MAIRDVTVAELDDSVVYMHLGELARLVGRNIKNVRNHVTSDKLDVLRVPRDGNSNQCWIMVHPDEVKRYVNERIKLARCGVEQRNAKLMSMEYID